MLLEGTEKTYLWSCSTFGNNSRPHTIPAEHKRSGENLPISKEKTDRRLFKAEKDAPMGWDPLQFRDKISPPKRTISNVISMEVETFCSRAGHILPLFRALLYLSVRVVWPSQML